MLTFLFLVNRYYDYYPLLEEAAKEKKVHIDIIEYDDITITYKDNQSIVTVKGQPISKYDLVHFRHITPSIEKTITLSEYFLHSGSILVDPAFSFSVPWAEGKAFDYMRLSHSDIPIISCDFLSKKEFERKGDYTYPLIVKMTTGSQGEGISMCTNKSEVLALFDTYNTDLVVQEYISNDGDIRVLVIGDEVVGAMKRKSANEKEFRNNFSLGGTVDIFDLDDQGKEIALRSARAMRYTIAGVDLIWSKKEACWKVIEVNRSPQFGGFMKATGINVPQVIIDCFIKTCSQEKSSV